MTHFKKVNNINECRFCDYRCKNSGDAKLHLKHFHDNMKTKKEKNAELASFSCTKCTALPFVSEASLLKHDQTLHQTIVYSCTECHFTCKIKRDFNKHLDKIHFGSFNQCPYCPYKTRHPLKSHLQIHKNCSKCKISFESHIQLKIHKINEHYSNFCPCCKGKSKFDEDFVVNVHSKKYSCSSCKEEFLSSSCLVFHQQNNIGLACNNCIEYQFLNGCVYTVKQNAAADHSSQN